MLNRVACADTFINFIHHYLHTLTYSNRNYKREEACGGQERACGKGNRRDIYIHCILNQLRYSTTVSQELSPSPVTISPPLCTQVPSRTAWRSSWDTLEARAHLGPVRDDFLFSSSVVCTCTRIPKASPQSVCLLEYFEDWHSSNNTSFIKCK